VILLYTEKNDNIHGKNLLLNTLLLTSMAYATKFGNRNFHKIHADQANIMHFSVTYTSIIDDICRFKEKS
jgi:hypothetical protein